MAGDAYWSNVSLLTHCDGANGSVPVDQKGKTITALASAGITTALYKFPTGSLDLNGTTQGVTVANSADFWFGSGNFTVELFASFDEIAATKFLFYYGPSQSWWLYRNAQTLQFSYSTDGVNSMSMPVTGNVITATGTWYHIAVVRNGAVLTLYVNGVSQSTLNIGSASFFNTTGILQIGSYNSGFFTDGRLDEIRITKGVARYTANFSAPTAAFDHFYTPDKFLSGVTRDASGALASKLVRAYRQDSGAFVGQVISTAGTGAFSIAASDTPHYITLHDTTSLTMAGAETGNAAVLDNITPV